MCDGELLLATCDVAPGEHTPVLMLADWCDEQGWGKSAAMLRNGLGMIGGGGGGDGYGYGDGGDGDGYGGGGGGYGYGDGGYGDGYGGDGDGGGGGGGDGDDGCGDGYGGYKLSRGFVVRNGLYIIATPAGYYPYVRVGWLSREDGLIRLRNCRIIKRFGTDAQLAVIAKKGPKENTQFLESADEEFTSVGLISRAIPCDPKKWQKHCPKPKEEAAEY